MTCFLVRSVVDLRLSANVQVWETFWQKQMFILLVFFLSNNDTFLTVLPQVSVLAFAGVASVPFVAVAPIQTRRGVADWSGLYWKTHTDTWLCSIVLAKSELLSFHSCGSASKKKKFVNLGLNQIIKENPPRSLQRQHESLWNASPPRKCKLQMWPFLLK